MKKISLKRTERIIILSFLLPPFLWQVFLNLIGLISLKDNLYLFISPVALYIPISLYVVMKLFRKLFQPVRELLEDPESASPELKDRAEYSINRFAARLIKYNFVYCTLGVNLSISGIWVNAMGVLPFGVPDTAAPFGSAKFIILWITAYPVMIISVLIAIFALNNSINEPLRYLSVTQKTLKTAFGLKQKFLIGILGSFLSALSLILIKQYSQNVAIDVRELLFFGALVLIVSIVIFLFYKDIMKRVLYSSRVISEFAETLDTNKKIDIFSQDEVGLLTHNYNKMLSNLSVMMNQLMLLAKGDLKNKQLEFTAEGQIWQEFDKMKKNLNALALHADLIAKGDLSNKMLDASIEGDLGKNFNRMVLMQKALSEQAGLIAAGDLDNPILKFGIDGDLGKVFLQMVTSLKNLLIQAELIAQGDMRNPALKKVIEGKLGSAFGIMNTNISDAIRKIKASSIDLASSSSELSASSTQINQSLESLSGRISDSVTSVTEISQSIKQVSENSLKVSEQANLTIDIARKGFNKTKESVSSLQEVQSEMSVAKNKLTDINNASNEIRKILRIIIDIADKTDMLAINASIEAASAGEYGKGFMVVADEVRRLADRSATSAQEIESTINRLLKGIDDIYASVESSYNGVEKSHGVAVFAGQALEEVVNTFENTARLVKQISYATQQQSIGSDEITRSIEGISLSSRESVMALNQMASLATQLHSISETLLSLVEKYKVD